MRTPRLVILLLLGAATTLAAALGAAPASAHGAEGKMTILRAEQTGPARAEVELGLLYANDSDVAEEATVTVTFTGPDGTTVGPVSAERPRGAHYVAATDLPAEGTWSFNATAESPAASADGTVEVAPAPPTTAPPAIEPPVTAAVAPPVQPIRESTIAAGPVALAAMAGAAVLAGVALARRRRPGGAAPASPSSPESGDTTEPAPQPAREPAAASDAS